MKKYMIFLLFLTLSVLQSFAQQKVSKRALIIAIGNYPSDSTGWSKISSNNDVAILKNALEFQEFNAVTVIQDNQATRQGILDAMTAFGKTLSPGCVALIHISSHGQQIQDYQNDEVDGMDEAIVAYDAPVNREYATKIGMSEYRGEKHLTDDDFGAKITELRKILGPDGDLVVFLDACHSGTGTRGDAKVRGGEPALVSPGFDASKFRKSNEVFMFTPLADEAKMAPYVVFSGARAEELNYEIRENEFGYGSLSFAVSKALKECDTSMTYRGLYGRICELVQERALKQHPTVEGNIDRRLFGGRVVEQQAFLLITEMTSKKSISINAGRMGGINDSTEVAVFPRGTSDPAGKTPLAKGYVVSAGDLSSKVELDKELATTNTDSYQVFVTKKTFGDVRVNVALGNFSDASLKASVEQSLKQNKVVVLVQEYADLIVEQTASRGSAEVQILMAANRVIYLDKVGKDKLNETLLRFAQARYMRVLDIESAEYNIELEFIPVTTTTDANGKKVVKDTLDIQQFIVNGMYEFPEEQNFLMKFTNKGTRTAYFNVIDIQPDGVISAIIPSNDKDFIYPLDYFKLSPGASMVWNKYTIEFYDPYGTEVYKVFSSKEPIDLTFAVTNSGTQKRGGETDLELLFRNTYDMQGVAQRGTKNNALNVGNYGVKDVVFVIKPK